MVCLLKDFCVLIMRTMRHTQFSWMFPVSRLYDVDLALIMFLLFYNFFCCFWVFPCNFPPFRLFLCGVHNQSSSASAPALVRCGQTEHCCCIASHPTISSIKFGKWHSQSHGTPENGFPFVSFCLFLNPYERTKILPVRDSVENDLSWMECHTLWDHYHGSRKDRIA